MMETGAATGEHPTVHTHTHTQRMYTPMCMHARTSAFPLYILTMLAAMVGTTCCASFARLTWAPALFQNVLIVLCRVWVGGERVRRVVRWARFILVVCVCTVVGARGVRGMCFMVSTAAAPLCVCD